MLEALAEWVRSVVETGGYPGVAAMIALENIFPPIPSELVLPLAGFLACRGDFTFQPAIALPLVILAATVGSLIGAYVLYGFGYILGAERVRSLVVRYGKWALLKESDLDRAERWFAEYGDRAVLIGRVIPGIRSIISIPAGIERMPLPQFSVYTTIGSIAWNALLISLGCALGDQWERVAQYVDIVTYTVIAIVLLLILWFVWQRLRSRRAAA